MNMGFSKEELLLSAPSRTTSSLAPFWTDCLEPTTEWTIKQKTWIGLQTVVTTCICFCASFGLCVLTYKGEEPSSTFTWPRPVAGSFVVTVVLQTVLNGIIGTSLMTMDVVKGRLPPKSYGNVSWWPVDGTKQAWYLNLSGLVIAEVSGSCSSSSEDSNGNGEDIKILTCTKRAGYHMLRLLPWIAFGSITVLPVFTLASYFTYDKKGYGDYPTPELLTGAAGASLALLTMPVWAAVILVYVGREYSIQKLQQQVA